MIIEPLHLLPTSSLQALAGSLESGLLSHGISRFGVQQAAGADAGEVERTLRWLATEGFSPSQSAVLVRAVIDTRRRQPDIPLLFDLVLSGPEVPGIPTADTAAVMHTLMSAAETQILMVGYAVYNGREIFDRLAQRMEERPELGVVFCLDIPRPHGDGRGDDEILRQFAHDFRSKHWPGKRLPQLYFDPRALSGGPVRASLHAKCVVVDSTTALVTSANFTEAAQHRNIEAGVMVRHHPTVRRLRSYFEGLITSGKLRVLKFPERDGSQ